MKVVLNDVKAGKSYQKEFENDIFINRKIGEKIEGSAIGLADFEFEITGGSDFAGFPHRKDIDGMGRKAALLSKGTGIRKRLDKGIKIRKTVVGNTFSERTAQVNLKVVKYGKENLAKALGIEEKPKEEKKAEEKPVEKPKEEIKAKEALKEPKKEAKTKIPKETKVEEKIKEAPKKEVKVEKKPKKAEVKPAEKEVKP